MLVKFTIITQDKSYLEAEIQFRDKLEYERYIMGLPDSIYCNLRQALPYANSPIELPKCNKDFCPSITHHILSKDGNDQNVFQVKVAIGSSTLGYSQKTTEAYNLVGSVFQVLSKNLVEDKTNIALDPEESKQAQPLQATIVMPNCTKTIVFDSFVKFKAEIIKNMGKVSSVESNNIAGAWVVRPDGTTSENLMKSHQIEFVLLNQFKPCFVINNDIAKKEFGAIKEMRKQRLAMLKKQRKDKNNDLERRYY